MNGRQEIDKKNEEWISKKLIDAPQVLKDYMSYIDGDNGKTSWSRRNYLGYLFQFFEFLKEEKINYNNINEFEKVKPLTIKKYLKYISYRIVNGVKKENKQGIKAAKLFAVSDFFNFLVENDYVTKNPCQYIDTPKDKEEKPITYLTKNEIKTISDNIKTRGKYKSKKYNLRDLCILSLGVTTGLRVSAIAEINVEDVDLDNNTIAVTEKGNKKRLIYIGEKTKELLSQWLKERKKILGDTKDVNAVFISHYKKRISTGAIRYMIANASDNIDKHITPHKMRSTCATNLYDATGDIYMVQEQLGHKNIANTKRYAKVSEDKMKNAANIMDDLI